MRKLIMFNNITLDGYFSGPGGDLSWAHTRRAADPEWNEYVAGNAQGGGQIILGRITYEMMVKYWPTEEAAKNDAEVAEGINRVPKIVISNSLEKTAWNNSKILKGDIAAEIRALKQQPGPGMAILGSGSIVRQLAEAGLIDEYQFVLNPVAIGAGRTLFDGLPQKLELKRTHMRAFNNGNVLLHYAPA